jgi:hypothetical protein
VDGRARGSILDEVYADTSGVQKSFQGITPESSYSPGNPARVPMQKFDRWRRRAVGTSLAFG